MMCEFLFFFLFLAILILLGALSISDRDTEDIYILLREILSEINNLEEVRKE